MSPVSCGDARPTRASNVTGLLAWIILRMFVLSVSFIDGPLAGGGDSVGDFKSDEQVELISFLRISSFFFFLFGCVRYAGTLMKESK